MVEEEVHDGVRIVSKTDSSDGVFEACTSILGKISAVAVAHLSTDSEQFGFIFLEP